MSDLGTSQPHPGRGLAPHSVQAVGTEVSFRYLLYSLKATKTFNMLRLIGLLTRKILAMFVPVAYREWVREVDHYYSDLNKLVDQRGLEWTVKYVKLSRLAVTRYLSGHPLTELPGVALVDGWPLWLSGFKPALQSKDGVRLLLTILTSLRGCHFKPTLVTEDITRPWNGFDSISEKELSAACHALGIRPRHVEFSFPHMSTKRGPLGQALLTSITEVTLLTPELMQDLIALGGSKLASLLEGLTDRLDILQWSSVAMIWAKKFPPKTKSLRRISYFSDKEGKTRVIAILDYWTQTALKPLHDALNSILRRISTDCTFNQNHFLTCLPPTGPYYSLDLHAATDRMPVSVQKRVIGRVIGESRAAIWCKILTSSEFTISGSTDTVKYAAGQPMGAYSSWPAMALTHHVLVRVSARRAGKTVFFDRYALLGDDLVIADSLVAQEYIKLLAQLDMPISETKSHVSDDTYEFAKRWVHRGEEVTGFSISGLFSVWKRYPLLHNFLKTQEHHGWILPISEHPDLITSLYKIFRGPKFIGEHCDRVKALYMVFNQVITKLDTREYSFSVIVTLRDFLGINAPWDNVLGYQETLKRAYLLAKKQLIERDLGMLQSDLYVVNDKLYKLAYEQIPDSADQATRDFLKETVSVMINWDNPLVLVLNRIVDSMTEQLLTVLDDEAPKEEFYHEAGLSKYFISKSVFSMKKSESKVLADSAVNKEFISVMKALERGELLVQDLRNVGIPLSQQVANPVGAAPAAA